MDDGRLQCLATRQAISDVATRHFFERVFDAVTVDEIADAADFGRVTVFNHFPRKEDMLRAAFAACHRSGRTLKTVRNLAMLLTGGP